MLIFLCVLGYVAPVIAYVGSGWFLLSRDSFTWSFMNRFGRFVHHRKLTGLPLRVMGWLYRVPLFVLGLLLVGGLACGLPAGYDLGTILFAVGASAALATIPFAWAAELVRFFFGQPCSPVEDRPPSPVRIPGARRAPAESRAP
jgi:hypothetical protein